MAQLLCRGALARTRAGTRSLNLLDAGIKNVELKRQVAALCDLILRTEDGRKALQGQSLGDARRPVTMTAGQPPRTSETTWP